jgi:hypothetical protein
MSEVILLFVNTEAVLINGKVHPLYLSLCTTGTSYPT